MTIRWFLSGRVRHATDMCKHVRKLLNAQRDLLPAEGIAALNSACDSVGNAIRSNSKAEELEAQLKELEKTGNRWLRPYPHPAWRENVEVLLVAIAVAMGIRTFFLQPFKIPTGSMQPTLYGVTSEDLRARPDIKIPDRFGRFVDAVVHGVFYHHLVAEDDGVIQGLGPPQHFLRFINRQSIQVQYNGRSAPTSYQLWFTPDEKFAERARIGAGQSFRKGEPILSLREVTGDHLFVDRVTYNFRRPNRGEIVVFKTKGISELPQNQFYIKRLVALGGEKVRIGDDRHLMIDGVRLDATTPRFENVYGFDPRQEPQESQYSGHLNNRRLPGHAPNFRDATEEVTVTPRHYMVMGDNTMNSSDSRTWGDFPQENVIGKAFFVYWPISNHGGSRFGWGYR